MQTAIISPYTEKFVEERTLKTTLNQSMSQNLETGRPNLFFQKQGVQNLNLQDFCMCIANKPGCPFSKLGVQKTPKGIAG